MSDTQNSILLEHVHAPLQLVHALSQKPPVRDLLRVDRAQPVHVGDAGDARRGDVRCFDRDIDRDVDGDIGRDVVWDIGRDVDDHEDPAARLHVAGTCAGYIQPREHI